jgi:hypothetical protein
MYVCKSPFTPFKVRVILIKFQWNLDLLDRFSKNIQIPNSMTICEVGICEVGIETELTKLKFGVRKFANAPEKERVARI